MELTNVKLLLILYSKKEGDSILEKEDSKDATRHFLDNGVGLK